MYRVDPIEGQARPGQARTVKCYNCNGTGHIVRNCTQSKRPQNSDYFKDKMLLMQAQENGVALDAEQLLFLADDAPTAQTMFMANLLSADPITDEAEPSYDSDILSEYVKDNDVSVVHRNASSVPNDTFMIIYDDMCEPIAPSESNSSRNAAVKNYLTAELAIYREQIKLYERRAKFELTEREQEINEQLRLENKLLADFLNMKSLKENVEDRLVKQDQSLQTFHMLCRPRPLYNDLNKVAIGYENPLCLTRAKQAQPALYNGHEILKDNNAQVKVHNSEDTLEIVELTRKNMNAKMTDPECVTHKVKIAPHDYSKENLLATFTPHKQLTPEQIYWSNDLMKLKHEILKDNNAQVKVHNSEDTLEIVE
nr:hypothetical protein [Tanacetum cinerariifolium]